MQAYLDNSATTPLCDTAKQWMLTAMESDWGNPSSLHELGFAAEKLREKARQAVAVALRCSPKCLTFTSGGTEANNLAVFGAAAAGRRKGNRVVVSAVEHPSVLQAYKRLGEQGFEVVVLPVDRFGTVPVSALEDAINEKTILVSLMYINNELGSVEPVDAVPAILKRKGAPALFHVDAVQAFGKIPVFPEKSGVDLLTVSAHKIHGPKGAGALFVRRGVHPVPQAVGGEQENRLRPGTEPMVAIAGFGGAASVLEPGKHLPRITALRDAFVQKLKTLDGVVLNSGDDASPYIVNLSLPGRPSEVVLNFLSDLGIYVSAGSACAKGHRSPVLAAAGIEPERQSSALRVSLSDRTTEEELNFCFDGLQEALRVIRNKL